MDSEFLAISAANRGRDAAMFDHPRSVHPEIGLTETEAARFSFVKLIRSAVDPSFSKRLGGFEARVVGDTLARSGLDTPGFQLPSEIVKRDLSVGTPSAGGHLVATNKPPAAWATALRGATRVRALGATVIESHGNTDIPRIEDGSTAAWVAEGAAPAESNPTFEATSFTPKRVTAYVDVTRRFLMQAGPSAEGFIVRELTAALGSAIDAAAINGSGASGQPLGILGTVGISTVAIGANGGAPTYAHLVDLEQAVAGANAEGDEQTLGFLTNSKVRRVLRTIEVAAGSGLVWPADRVLGHRAAVTELVPSNLTKGSGTNLSAIVYANWAELYICEFSPIDILVDRYTQAGGQIVRIVVGQEIDVALRQPAAAAVIVDAIAA